MTTVKWCRNIGRKGDLMLSLQEVLAATGGRCDNAGDIVFTGVTTDSRVKSRGELFVALSGERFDGHEYCQMALANGAAAVLVAKPVAGLAEGAVVITVADTLLAYQQIAHAYRMRHKDLKVVAITGSNGKTSTKDMIAACLATKFKVVKTQGNFNNEIGLPKTLLSIEPDTEIVVTEMGMRGLGQIKELCDIAKPDVAVVTNVGETHMELLGSMENIAKAKSEIVEDLTAAQVAVLNADNEYVAAMADKTKARVVTYGYSANATFRGDNVVTTAQGSVFTCINAASGERTEVNMPFIGEHNVQNALAAIAAAATFGVKLNDSAKALTTAKLTGSRQEIVHIGTLTVINDAYNASPASMEAALKTLHEAKKAEQGARTIAVLADMLELGDISADSHRRVGQFAVREKVDIVIAYGEESKAIAAAVDALGGKAYWFADRDGAAKLLDGLLEAHDVVLLKGSHSMQVDGLLDLVFKNKQL